MIPRYFKAGACGFALLAITSALPVPGYCADRERVGQSYIDMPGQLEKGTTKSLKGYVSRLLSTEYVSAAKLYDPPFEGLEEMSYFSVRREQAVPIIAGGVSSFAGNEEGLAAALYDGTIRIWSNLDCRKVSLPGGGGAESLGYGPGSPTLAATSRDGEKLYVYDLKQCERVPGDIPVGHGPVKKMAVSRTGDWLGIIDNFNTLRCGSSKGPLNEVGVLEGTPVYLGFTPAQGVLIAVEASGRIIKMGMKNMSRMDSDHVPGGPFKKVRGAGYILCLTADDGSDVYWDLRKRSVAKKSDVLREQPSWIYERGDSLVYSTGVDRWKVSEHMGMPMFIVSHSVKEKLLRVRDLDGETRYYSTLDGKECSGEKADDWKVTIPRKGVYKVGEASYRLYDKVFQKGMQLLNCRHIEGRGFYLWWEQSSRYANMNPHPLELPIRESMLADRQALWVPLIEGEIR